MSLPYCELWPVSEKIVASYQPKKRLDTIAYVAYHTRVKTFQLQTFLLLSTFHHLLNPLRHLKPPLPLVAPFPLPSINRIGHRKNACH